MIKHLFKLIWNKKKENFLLISEVLVSFMVMFAVISMLVYYYQNYNTRSGFKYEDVWTIQIGETNQPKDKDSIMANHENLKNVIRSLSKVQEVSYTSDNIPFSSNNNQTSISYHHLPTGVNNYMADLEFARVMDLELTEGRWFNHQDRLAGYLPLVITTTAAAKMGLTGHAVGKMLDSEKQKLKVVGVVQDLKDKGTFKPSSSGMYRLIDTSNVNYTSSLVLKVSPDADARFEDKLFRLVANTVKSGNVEIKHLTEMRQQKNKEVIIPLIILIVVSGFLIINVGLGLFGVLWYNISKRRGEIGLRRAIGASAANVSWQLVGEALVLATFSLVIGVFFAIQFPLLHVFDLPASVYLIAMFLSILFIYLLVVFCALYPGKQAAGIQPAMALHED